MQQRAAIDKSVTQAKSIPTSSKADGKEIEGRRTIGPRTKGQEAKTNSRLVA
jgi:hypothetical protein